MATPVNSDPKGCLKVASLVNKVVPTYINIVNPLCNCLVLCIFVCLYTCLHFVSFVSLSPMCANVW